MESRGAFLCPILCVTSTQQISIDVTEEVPADRVVDCAWPRRRRRLCAGCDRRFGCRLRPLQPASSRIARHASGIPCARTDRVRVAQEALGRTRRGSRTRNVLFGQAKGSSLFCADSDRKRIPKTATVVYSTHCEPNKIPHCDLPRLHPCPCATKYSNLPYHLATKTRKFR